MARASNEPHQLLVEGENDLYVCAHLCERHGIPEFRIEIPGASGGIEELLRDIPVRLQQRTLRTLGVIVDADRDLLRQWQRLRTPLASLPLTLPIAPLAEGWVVDTRGPVGPLRIGIWIMPNNTDPGILEDFAATLIPNDDPLLPHAESAIAAIEAAGLNRYQIHHRPKALIHTWLAWQENPGNRMGTAIKSGHLRHDSPTALAFVAWLRRLFEPSPSTEVV